MTKRKRLSPYKKFASLSAAEKEDVYHRLDDPDIALKAKPLSPAMKKLWKRAKGKAGRPRVGRGAARVLLSIERGLLDQADAFAIRRKMTRSELFSCGVRAMLRRAG
jgi:hypothetical protein